MNDTVYPNDNVHSLAAPYAVDALTDAERDAFLAHLPECDDCQHEVASLSLAVEELAVAQETTPPAGLKLNVMDQVRRTAQLPPALETIDVAANAQSPATPHAQVDVQSPADAPTQADELAARRHRRARRTWALSATAAASAVVLTLVGITVADSRAQREAELAVEKDAMMVMSAPDATSMDLELGAGHVIASDRMDSLAIMGDNAPMPDDGMEYQLWLVMADGTKMAGPTFMPHDDGQYMAVVDADVADMEAVAVTMEPPGGSDAPTSDAVCITTMPGKA
ncbi:anti-sigma factor [Demequina sediminicola]|uniref:anti-sigma factor n=1 Tax=Demequina sediminicola TaxID=1095026 RepID=UPI0007859748|nr:anti-sigma factor [Demequina sediminicola]